MSPSRHAAHPLLRSHTVVTLIALLALVFTGMSVSQAHAAEAPPAGTYTGTSTAYNGATVSFNLDANGTMSGFNSTSYCSDGLFVNPVQWAGMPPITVEAGQSFSHEWEFGDDPDARSYYELTGTVNADGTASGTGRAGFRPPITCGGMNFEWTASTEVTEPEPVYEPTAQVSPSSLTVSELADEGVVIEGQDFPPATDVEFSINGSSVGTETSFANGNVILEHTSTTLGAGTHNVLLTSGDLEASTTFTVEADAPVYNPAVSVSPSSLTESEVAENGITITATGFPANEMIGLTVVEHDLGGMAQTDADGNVTVDGFMIGDTSPGTHTIRASFEDLSATDTFTVVEDDEPVYDPQLSVSPTTMTVSEALADGVDITITGFPANTDISLTSVNGQSGSLVATDANGGVFVESWPAGGLGAGAYEYIASYEDLSASATLTVTEDDDPVYDPQVTVDPSSVTESEIADSGVTITGTGFPESTYVVLTVGGIVIESADSNASGTVVFNFVSDEFDVGQHTVLLASDDVNATSTLTITEDPQEPVYDPSVTLSPSEVTVSAAADPGVTISGSGFPEDATVTLFIDGVEDGTASSDAQGDVDFLYTSNSIAVGNHTVTLTADGEGATASATLSVIADPVVTEPSVEVTPSTVTQSDLATSGVTVTGVNFPASEPVALTVDGVDAGTQTADADGTVTIGYTSDTLAPGTYTALLANGDQWAQAQFTVEVDPDPVYNPEISLSTTEVTESELATDGVDVTGTGFPANALVTLFVGDEEVTSGDSNADGVAVFTLWAENIGPGDYTVRLEADAEGAHAETTLTVIADEDADPVTIPATQPSPDDLDPALEGAIDVPGEAAPGDSIVITLDGVEPGTEVGVWIFSDPAYLGTHIVDANGQVTVTIPAALASGTHTISVWTEEGLVGWETIVITAAGDDGAGTTDPDTGADDSTGAEDELAVTGGTLAVGTLVGGAFLLVIGFGLVMLGRNRARVIA